MKGRFPYKGRTDVFEDLNVVTYFDPLLQGVVSFCTDEVRGITGILGVLGDGDEAAAHLSGLERGDGGAPPGSSSGEGETQSTKAALAP